MSMISLPRTALCGFVFLVALAPAVWAHAILLEASPAKNGSIAGPDIQIHLKFNSRIDGGRSQISLVLPDSTTRTLTIEKQDTPAVISARATGLKTGAYHLRWQVLASDGHITRGEYAFDVK